MRSSSSSSSSSVASARPNPSLRRRRSAAIRAALEPCEPRRLMASVSGLVFADYDRDGVRDADEGGVANVFVFNDRNRDGIQNAGDLSATTGADGRYRIEGVPADGASQLVRLNTGDAVTAPAGGAHFLRFASDYEAGGRNFGLAVPNTGTVQVTVFLDRDANGSISDGDGDPNVLEAWVDLDRDGLRDGNEPSLPEGPPPLGAPPGTPYFPIFYGDLTPGTYSLAIRLVGDGDARADYAAEATVTRGQTTRLQLPIRVAAATATVTGTVFTDADQDGVRDAGEAGLAGKTVYADLDYDGVKDAGEPSAVTNGSGFYSIGGISPQSTSVAIRLLGTAASQITTPASGFHSGRIAAANTYANRNFGLRPAAPTTTTIRGVVFDDADLDGVRDAGEGTSFSFGVSSVYADLNGNGSIEDAERANVNTSTGAYALANVPAGRSFRLFYTYEYGGSVEAGEVVQTTPIAIGYDAGIPVTTAAAAFTNLDIGFGRAGTLAGYAVVDVNGNGTADAGDPLTSGTFWLDADGDRVRDAGELAVPYGYRPRTGGGPIAQTVLSVPYGTYNVAFSRSSTAPVGTAAEQSRAVTVSAGSPDAAPRFAVAPTTPGVSGIAYYDENNNGSPDAGEGAVSEFATIFADYNDNGRFDTGEANVEPPYGPAGTPFYLPVEAGRSFTLRLVNFDGEAIGTTTYARTLTGTGQATGLNFRVAPTTGSVSGTVFRDSDADGARDAGEAGISGLIVYADKNYNGTRDAGEIAAVTDADGLYRITGFAADGTSTAVRVVEPQDRYYNGITTPAGGAHSVRFASAYEAANRNFGLEFVVPN